MQQTSKTLVAKANDLEAFAAHQHPRRQAMNIEQSTIRNQKAMKRSLSILVVAGTLVFAGQAQAQAAAIAHWSFDSDVSTETTSNDSIGSNHLTRQSEQVTFGNTGGAFGGFMRDDSNQSSAYALMAETIVLEDRANTDGWAISFWLNNWSIGSVVMGEDTDVDRNKLWIRDNDANPRMQMRDIRVEVTATGANLVRVDNWTHFAIVREGDGTANLYIDGTVYSGGTDTQNVDFSINSLGFGRRNLGFRGDLDEVWIFDAALTSSEVTNLFKHNNIAGIPPPKGTVITLR